MSSLTQFLGQGPTTSIVNYYSAGGTRSTATLVASDANGAKEALPSGELTADVLATVLTVTGGGSLPYLVAYVKDTTDRTIRMEVTVDGVVVFDATSNSGSWTTGFGIIAAGQIIVAGRPAHAITFNSSLVVKVASSRTETDKVAIGYVLYKR